MLIAMALILAAFSARPAWEKMTPAEAQSSGHPFGCSAFAMQEETQAEYDAQRVLSLLVRGCPLFESGDPYFEADEVLGKLWSCAQLHQLLYARPIFPSLGLCYLLRAFSGYRVKIVHVNSPS